MLKRVMSRFSVEIFFVSQYRKTLQGNPSVLCFGKFSVANKFMDKKGGLSNFSVETFCLTVPKNAVGEPFSLTLISGIEKFWMRGWKGVSRFSVENFLSHSACKYRRATL